MIKRILLVLIIILIFLSFNNKNNKVVNTDDIIGTLYIPKINLNKKIYDYNSPLNNVNKNVMIIDTSINNTYLLAAHSGTGYLAFFNDLKYLKVGDLVYFSIYDKDYIYEVINIRKEIKDGNINIPKKEDMLILTTCDQVDKGYQLIIECNLKKN